MERQSAGHLFLAHDPLSDGGRKDTLRNIEATEFASDVVKPPSVAESQVNYECRLLQVVPVRAEPLFVAIKVLPPDKVAHADRKRRFIQEAQAASALNHPNIVIHDINEENGLLAVWCGLGR